MAWGRSEHTVTRVTRACSASWRCACLPAPVPHAPHTVLTRPLPRPQSAHMLTRVYGLAVRQLLRTARAGLQSEIGLRTKLAADWARTESNAGWPSAEPVLELDGGRAGAFHAECLARNSRDAAAALSLSMRTLAWQALPLKQVAGNNEAVKASGSSGRGGSSASASALCESYDRRLAGGNTSTYNVR